MSSSTAWKHVFELMLEEVSPDTLLVLKFALSDVSEHHGPGQFWPVRSALALQRMQEMVAAEAGIRRAMVEALNVADAARADGP